MEPAEEEVFVLTEAEKDVLKRKRTHPTQSPPTPPPTQQEDMDCFDGADDACCDECGNFILPQDEGECPYCIDAMLQRMKHSAQGNAEPEEEEEDEQGEDEQPVESGLPDLHDYFNQFPAISDENVISMCRAYASYLASLSKKKIFKSPDPVITKKRRTRQTR